MSIKFALLFVTAFVIFQCLTWETTASVVRRDTEDQEPKLDGLDQATKELQKTLDDMQANLNKLADDIKNDPLIKNFTETIEREFNKLTAQATPEANAQH